MKTVFLLITVIILGCSTSTKKQNSIAHKLKTKSPINPYSSINNNESKNLGTQHKPQTPKIIIGKFNIDNVIKLTLRENWKKESWFEEIDNKNGYARMGGYREGADEYFLFIGLQKNLLVKVIWGCGPACEQVVRFYEIINNNPKKIQASKLFDKSFAHLLKNQLAVCLGKNGEINDWSNHRCHLMFDFPRYGTKVKVFNALFKDNDIYEGPLEATLKWNRKNFNFSIHK